ncbi:GuaB1 family IMP dehydrogenase-related protein [Leucobacter sp. USHLN154]|uniref:GMP reductase n=1 Tax=Leucobacter sp. USHLN154 TaxID=3081269 RepID=UPI00301A7436
MEFLGATPTVDLTYSDVFLVPRHSEVRSRLDVALAPDDGTPATIPLVAANMNSVTGPRLAAVLARRGGLAVLPQDLSPEATSEAIRRVKHEPVAVDGAIVLPPDATAADALRWIPNADGQLVVVADDERSSSRATATNSDAPPSLVPIAAVRGTLGAHRLSSVPSDARLGDLLHAQTVVIEESDLGDARAAFDAVDAALRANPGGSADAVCVVRDGMLLGTLSRRSALRASIYRPALDVQGRLAVAAAVGINGDVAAKARALAESGADVLVVDTAHGHQGGMLRALESVARLDLGVPIVAGNVVTAEGVQDLVSAGASILKVGVGPGAMCTTRMMTAVGRPQFSAVLETAHAARELGAHVWADGGVRYPRDVALALAAGASSVMIGSWFAGTAESPGELLADADGRQYKESWGMASAKAVQGRFGGLDAFDLARKQLFAEGISSSKIYLDPQRPGVEDLIDMITSGVRSSFTYAGAESVAAFHDRARVGLQSAAGYEEGKALPVSW